MKKISIVLTILFAISFAAHAQTVGSANVMGYTKVSKPAGGLQLMAVAWEDSPLTDLITTSQFYGHYNIGDADTIITWDAESQGYVKYALFSTVPAGGDITEWRSFTNFYGTAVNPTLEAGSAIWIKSPSAPGDTNILTSGNVTLDQSVTNLIVSGLQMLAYPFSAKATLNEMAFIESGAKGHYNIGSADTIITWDAESQGYVKYALFSTVPAGGDITEWRSFTNFYGSAVNPTLDLGSGFWYKTQTNFSWVATNNYFHKL